LMPFSAGELIRKIEAEIIRFFLSNP